MSEFLEFGLRLGTSCDVFREQDMISHGEQLFSSLIISRFLRTLSFHLKRLVSAHWSAAKARRGAEELNYSNLQAAPQGKKKKGGGKKSANFFFNPSLFISPKSWKIRMELEKNYMTPRTGRSGKGWSSCFLGGASEIESEMHVILFYNVQGRWAFLYGKTGYITSTGFWNSCLDVPLGLVPC